MASSFNETTDNLLWLNCIEKILGSLSVMGSGLIIFIFFININKITPAFELILQLSISSLINSISYIILFIPPDSTDYHPTTCKLQGFLMLFSELSTIMISTVISFYIWKTKAQFAAQDRFIWKERLVYLSFNYLIPLIFSLICYQSIGENGRWCWIEKSHSEDLALMQYLAIWIMIILNIIFAWLTNNITLDNLHSEDVKNRKEYIKKLSRYPMISLCCWLPATINRIIDIIQQVNGSNYEKLRFYFEILHIIFILVQGLLYGFVSLSSIDSGKNIKMLFKSCMCCCNCDKKISQKPHDDLTKYLSNTDNRITIDSSESSFSDRKISDSQKIRLLN